MAGREILGIDGRAGIEKLGIDGIKSLALFASSAAAV